jgi:hypothetical protein
LRNLARVELACTKRSKKRQQNIAFLIHSHSFQSLSAGQEAAQPGFVIPTIEAH